MTVNGLKLAAYNQGVGGRRCHGCKGVPNCEFVNMTVLPICSTSVCSYCENLDAVMSFDTMEYLTVENVSITIRGEHRSVRSFKFYYSVESIEGPYKEFSSKVFEIPSMSANTYNFTTDDGSVVIGRYWRLEILSNFGDPEHVELVELQLFGEQMNINKLDSYYKWIDGSDCSSRPLSTTSFTFAFASEEASVDNGEFYIVANSVRVGPFSPKNDSAYIRDALYDQDFVTTVSKMPAVVGNKYGQEFIVEFYSNVIPSILTSADGLTGLEKFPNDLFLNQSYVDPNQLSAYCVDSQSAVIISTFAAVPSDGQPSLCIGNQEVIHPNVKVYGINTITPSYGPIDGILNMHMEGSFLPSMNITMVSNEVSSSKDCLDAVSILEQGAYPLDAEVVMEIATPETMENARFCVQYDDDTYAVVPSSYFSIQTPAVTEVKTSSCNFVLLGESVLTLTGSGLHVGDVIRFVKDIENGSMVNLGVGSVITENGNSFEVSMNFTTVGEGYLIADFSGQTKVFPEVKVLVYDLRTNMHLLVSGMEMRLEVFVNGPLMSNDSFLLMSGDDVLNIRYLKDPDLETDMGMEKKIYQIVVDSPADTREYTLYYLANRKDESCNTPLKLNATFSFHDVSSVTTKMVNEEVNFVTTVLNKETTLTLTGLSFGEADTAYYYNEVDDIRVNINFFSTSATQRVGNLTFTHEGSYYLIYGFKNGDVDVEVPYRAFAMNVSSITGIAVGLSSSKDQMTVEGFPTLVEYIGHGIHNVYRDAAYKSLTPDPSLTGGNDANGLKYASNRAVASHGPYVTVDAMKDPMDAVFAFENGGRSTELNHWIIYDFKILTTIHEFGMYVNSVFFQQLPRDFQLQRLMFCYDDSCLFDSNTNTALENAPWETVLTVKDMDKDSLTALGGYKNYTLDRDVSARYYRLYITKNWGNPVYTSVIQVNFVGASADGDNMNRALLTSESAGWSSVQALSVSANGHCTLSEFSVYDRFVLWYDFSRTDSMVDPIRLDDIFLKVARVSMDSVWAENDQVASNVVKTFNLTTVYGRAGDKIKFALPGSKTDADCWEADSQAFGSVVDVQEITLQFADPTFSGSFIVETSNAYFEDLNNDASSSVHVAMKQERTVPIHLQDSDQAASIKLEQLTGVDKAQVVIQRTSSRSVTVTISVLEPALAQPDFKLLVPGGSQDCIQCDYVELRNYTEFVFRSQGSASSRIFILQIADDTSCSMSDFLLNRQYEMKLSSFVEGSNVFTFTPVTFIDSKTLIVANPSLQTNFNLTATEVKTCPSSNECTPFSSALQSSVIVHKTRGHAAVGVTRVLEGATNMLQADVTFIYSSSQGNLNAPLCYKFGDLPWKLYDRYMINLRSVIDVQPRNFILGEPREVTFTGTEESINENDVVRVLWRGEDCNDVSSAVEFQTESGEIVTELRMGASGKVTMNFHSVGGVTQAFTLCYKFVSDQFVNYPFINFNVMNVMSLTADDSTLADNFAVANQSKTFVINGNGLSEADDFFFVSQTATECNPNAAVPAVRSGKILLSQNQLRFTISFQESYPDSLKICYRFNNYDSQRYIMNGNLPLYVVSIFAVDPTYGFAKRNATLVRYIGMYPPSYTANDHAEWRTSSEPPVTVNVSNNGGNHTSSVQFSTNGTYILSYQFGNEPFMEYPNIVMHSLELLRLQNPYAVVGCLYRPVLELYYYRGLEDPSVKDSLAFRRVGGSCWSPEDKLPIVGANGAQSNFTEVLDENGDKYLAHAEFLVSGISGGSYSVCYRWSNRDLIDYQDIQATFYNFAGFSVLGGSTSDSLVERISKTLNVMGYGVGEKDEIRLIIPKDLSDPMCSVEANKGDEECDSPYEGKTFTVDADKKVNIQVDSTPSGKLQVCYKFANIGYFVKMPVYLTVYGLNSVTVNQGSADVMVVGVPKTFTFNGLGISEQDHVYWGLTCSGDASDRISEAVQLDASLSATFLFTNATTTELTLCFGYGQQDYQSYPNFRLTVKELQTVSSVDHQPGEAEFAIVDQAKTMEFRGVGIASDGTVDVARWVRGTSCESDVVPLLSSSTLDMGSIDFEVDANDADRYMQITSSSSRLGSALKAASSSANSVVVGSDHTASFLFAEDSSEQEDEHFFLCYKFGDEPFKLYEEITMRVYDLYDAASYSKNDKSDSKYLMAAGTMSTVEFSGFGIAEGDHAYWVRSDRTCRPMNALPITSLHLYEENIVYVDSLLKTSVNFVNGYDGAVSICYQFKDAQPKRYNFPYHVARVNAVHNADGTAVFVGNVPVTLTFYGYHINSEESQQPDLFGWTKGEDCSSGLVPMLDVDGTKEEVTMLPLNGTKQATVQFLEGGTFSLCHVFGKEAVVHYADVQIEVDIIQEIIPWWTPEESAMGYSMSRVAVKGVMKRWNVRGVFEAGDLLRFAMTGDCNCNLARMALPQETSSGMSELTEIPILLDTATGNYYFTVAFLDAMNVYNQPFTVCYRSRNDLLYYPTTMKIEVYTIEEISSSVGATNVLVAGEEKTLAFSSLKNVGVSANDKIGFSLDSSCTQLEIAAMQLDENFQVAVQIDASHYDNFNLCYQFAGQPFMSLGVVRVFDVMDVVANCEDCSNNTSIMYVTKEFQFHINGQHMEGVPEYAKWVYGDEGCDGRAALLSETEGATPKDYSAELVEITEVVPENASNVSKLIQASTEVVNALQIVSEKASLTFLQSSYSAVDNQFRLCYKFGDEPFKLYPDIRMTVVGIDSISSNKGQYSTMLVNEPETWVIQGFGFSDKDKMRLVVGMDCHENVMAETDVYATNPVEAYVKDLTIAQASASMMTLCWKFDEEDYTLMPKFTVTVNEVTSAAPAFAIQGIARTFAYEGLGVKMGDRIRYATGDCEHGVALYDGISDVKLSSDHTVSLKFDAASLLPYKLCYKFDEEPYKQYEAFAVDVATVTGMRYDGIDYASLTLGLGVDYEITVTGINVHAGDRIQFVPSRYQDCQSISATNPPLFETPVVVEGDVDKESVKFTVKGEISGSYKMCYAFGSELEMVLYPDYTLVFQGVLDVVANYGDDFTLVAGHEKVFTITGTEGVGAGDRVSLTRTSRCEAADYVALNAEEATSVTVDANNQIAITVQETSSNAELSSMDGTHHCFGMCYSYQGSPDAILMKHFCYATADITPMTIDVIQGQPTQLQLEGYMFQNGDQYAWTTASDGSCEDAGRAGFVSSAEGESLLSVKKAVPFYPVPSAGYIEEDNTDLYNLLSSFQDASSWSHVESASFDAAMVEAGVYDASNDVLTASLCYKFGSEPMYHFDLAVDTLRMTEVTPSAVTLNANAVLRVSLSRPIHNAFVKFVAAGTSCSSSSSDSANALLVGGVSEFNATQEISGVVTVEGAMQEEYTPCLRLGAGEYHAFSQFPVRLVHFALKPEELLVADYPSTLTVTSRVGVLASDRCYFTTSDVCSGADAMELVIDGAKSTTFSPAADFISLTFLSSGKELNLCCQFAEGAMQLVQTNVIAEVAQLLYLRGLNVHYSMLPYNMEKQMRLYGSGLVTGEFWLTRTDAECDDVNGRLELGGVENNAVSVLPGQNNEVSMVSLGRDIDTYTLCYSYRSAATYRYDQFLFYSISMNDVVAANGENFKAVVNVPKTFYVYGSHLSTNDYIGFAFDAECTSMVSVAEGDGHHVPLQQNAEGTLFFSVTFLENSENTPTGEFSLCFNSYLNGNIPVDFKMRVFELLQSQWSQEATAASGESVTIVGTEGEKLSVKGFRVNDSANQKDRVKFVKQGGDEEQDVLEFIGADEGTGDRLPEFSSLPDKSSAAVASSNVISAADKVESIRSALQSAQDVGTVAYIDNAALVEGFDGSTNGIRFMDAVENEVVEPFVQFGYEDFARSPKAAFELYHIDDFRSAEEASGAHDVVVDMPKAFRLVGEKVGEGDKFWFVEPSLTCADQKAEITFEGQRGRQEVVVTAEAAAEANATSSFLLTFHDKVPALRLCYQFSARADVVKDYASIQLSLHTINAIAPSSVRVNKWADVEFTDAIGVSAGDHVRWIANDGVSDCSQNIIASGEIASATNATASFFFRQPTGGVSSVYLCYKFGEEEWMAYASLKIQLAESMSMMPHDAVLSLPREFTVQGSAQKEEDRFAFVPVAESCEGVANAVAATSLGEHIVSFSWTFPSVDSQYKLCYLSEGVWMEYADLDFLVSVYTVTGMPTVDMGASEILVSSLQKDFMIEGVGTDNEGNSLFFVPAESEGCAANFDIAVEPLGSSRYRLSTSVASGVYELCYQFSSFQAVRYPSIRKTVISFSALHVAEGDVAVAVKDVLSTYSVSVQSVQLQDEDHLWFGRSGTECAEAVPLLDAAGAPVTELAFSYPYAGTHTVSFTETGTFDVCYRFALEQALRTGFVVSVKDVTGRTPAYVYDNIPSPVSFLGVGIGSGDVARWIPAGEDCSSASAVSAVVSGSSATYTMTPVSEEGQYYELCYQFLGSPAMKHYPALTMIVKPLGLYEVSLGCR